MTEFFKDVMTAGHDPVQCYWEWAGFSPEPADRFWGHQVSPVKNWYWFPILSSVDFSQSEGFRLEKRPAKPRVEDGEKQQAD